jgi:hypothetical protein
MPDRRTLEGVEIARVGTFRLSTGEHTFTREQLAAAVANAENAHAAHRDRPRSTRASTRPSRRRPGVREGRQPAPGRGRRPAARRPRRDARVARRQRAIAYPGRSLEGVAKGDDLEIRAVKLLGTTKPGITTLADLEGDRRVRRGRRDHRGAGHDRVRTLWARRRTSTTCATRSTDAAPVRPDQRRRLVVRRGGPDQPQPAHRRAQTTAAPTACRGP